jgi:integrase
LRHIFNDELEKGTIKYDIFKNLKAPEHKAVKGIWFNPNEQCLIYKNRHKCSIGNEIEFFLMVGCRLNEAFKCKIDFDKYRVFVERTKRDGTSGYVKISKKYAEHLKINWCNMFKHSSRYYTATFGELLNSLKIERQKNELPIHRLRHTFATNIYYLGAKDSKQRAYLLGHKSSGITDDVYTDFDPSIKKQDIINIYGNLYPKY